MERSRALLAKPWLWSFLGALRGLAGHHRLHGGHGGGGMLSAALALAQFTVIVGIGQMFVITLGPGNVDLSLPANIGLASAVAMKVMAGSDSLVAIGLLAALACGTAIGAANYLLIRALRIPPIIATLSASFIIQSADISYGRGLQIKPPPGFADFTNLQVFGIPILTILTAAFSVVAGIAPRRMVYGRSVLAIGQNSRAAWLAAARAVARARATRCRARLEALTARCWPAISAGPTSTSATNTCSPLSQWW